MNALTTTNAAANGAIRVPPADARLSARYTPGLWRGALIGVIALAAGAALVATAGAPQVATADEDLTRLLRGMAAIKAAMCVALLATVWWRMAAPIGAVWFSAHAGACCAMVAGVMMIWEMTYLGLGALLLHAGLLAACLLLWRDPAVSAGLAKVVAARRRKIKSLT